MKVQYSVHPVTRWVVERSYSDDDGRGGAETKGEFRSEEEAYQAGYALAERDRRIRGYRPGDERIQYPKRDEGEAPGRPATEDELRAIFGEDPKDEVPSAGPYLQRNAIDSLSDRDHRDAPKGIGRADVDFRRMAMDMALAATQHGTAKTIVENAKTFEAYLRGEAEMASGPQTGGLAGKSFGVTARNEYQFQSDT